MAARSSDLDEQKPGTNIQKEDHTLTPPSSPNDPEDPEAFGSTPSKPPSQSLARKPDYPKTWYCLEIQVISTEDDKIIPPPCHTWQVPIMEDMVWEGRTGLIEAIVTSPGWAILFYGWQLLGEGLNLGEVRDATFTLSGVIAWVGKQVQLSAKSVSLGNGRQLIAQAITKGHIEQGGLATLIPFNLHQCHSVFIIKTCPHDQPTSQWLLNNGRCPSLDLRQDSRSKAGHHSKAGIEVRDNKSYGWLHPSCLHIHQTMDLRVIGAQHQLHHQCCQCLRGWEDQGVHTLASVPARNQEAIWRSTSWSLRTRTLKMLLHTRVGTGT